MKLNSVSDVYNSTVDVPIYNELWAASNADKSECASMLNERTKRTLWRIATLGRSGTAKTLDARWHKFNDGASRGSLANSNRRNITIVRSPQAFLDSITNSNGSALSNEEKKTMQNQDIKVNN